MAGAESLLKADVATVASIGKHGEYIVCDPITIHEPPFSLPWKISKLI